MTLNPRLKSILDGINIKDYSALRKDLTRIINAGTCPNQFVIDNFTTGPTYNDEGEPLPLTLNPMGYEAARWLFYKEY